MICLNVHCCIAAVLVLVLIFVADCEAKPRITDDNNNFKRHLALRPSADTFFGSALILGGLYAILDRIGLGFLIKPMLGIVNFFYFQLN